MTSEAGDVLDVKLDPDLDELNTEGRLDENSAMQVQTVRDLARLLARADTILKAIEPIKKKNIIRIVSRDSKIQ